MTRVNTPSVTVVLPAYNAELFVRQSIDSILCQTYADFELLLIDDGSTDTTSHIMQEFEASDGRVKLLRFEQNRGLISALNWGCQSARGQYIAIMHADDISHPERLARQIEFLDQHSEIGLLGSASQIIDEPGRPGPIITVPVQPGLIKWALYFGNCIVHPTVMMRRDVIEAVCYYSPDAFLVDDYELWMRIGRISRIANLPVSLLKYRFWPGNATALHQSQVEARVTMLVQKEISELLGRAVPLDIASSLRRIQDPRAGSTPATLEKIIELQAFIMEMYQTYSKRESELPAQEHQLVADDAGFKLMVLSKLAARYSIQQSIRLAGYALRLSPRVPIRAAQILFRKTMLNQGFTRGLQQLPEKL